MITSALLLSRGAIPCIASAQVAYWLLCGGLLVVTATLGVLLWTRWGHSSPLHKCAALSLIVHLSMVSLTMTVRIVGGEGHGGGGGGGGPPIHVRIIEDAGKTSSHKLTTAAAAPEVAAPPLLAPPPKKERPKPTEVVEKPVAEPEAAPPVVIAPPKENVKQIVEPKVAKESPAEKPKAAEVVVKPTSPPQPPAAAVAAAVADVSVGAVAAKDGAAAPAATQPPVAITEVAASTPTNIYALRNAPGRLGIVAGQGGNAQTEAAVSAALHWLAAAQAHDGRWDAVQHGGGQEEMVLGQNRGGAGRGADTGITALALLAFLGAGHSHVQGEYRDNVRHGLDFLLRSQAADGSLYGDATLYAQMYCHSMATFALAEAQAVTQDRRLEVAVTKAVNFSLTTQNTTTGGWRYRPGDTGDTSQLGWQIMALASAERAGVDVPDQTWDRVERFLRTVRRGNSGGLASYRPDSPVSTSMTAEAFYCRLVLDELTGANIAEPAANEGTSQILASLPSTERVNLYYWYYATLALHQRQHSSEASAAAWHSWNDAMTAALTATQTTEGTDAGSWNSNTMWGGYGGRVYTTSMAAMCLEVYYRYAPAQNSRGDWTAARPDAQPTKR